MFPASWVLLLVRFNQATKSSPTLCLLHPRSGWTTYPDKWLCPVFAAQTLLFCTVSVFLCVSSVEPVSSHTVWSKITRLCLVMPACLDRQETRAQQGTWPVSVWNAVCSSYIDNWTLGRRNLVVKGWFHSSVLAVWALHRLSLWYPSLRLFNSCSLYSKLGSIYS